MHPYLANDLILLFFLLPLLGNHKFVTDKFPIGDPLPEEADLDAREDEHEGSESKPEKKVFGDQLDWWEKIGRWR
jgi:hypothetical protein